MPRHKISIPEQLRRMKWSIGGFTGCEVTDQDGSVATVYAGGKIARLIECAPKMLDLLIIAEGIIHKKSAPDWHNGLDRVMHHIKSGKEFDEDASESQGD
jgi:hypothetical protein